MTVGKHNEAGTGLMDRASSGGTEAGATTGLIPAPGQAAAPQAANLTVFIAVLCAVLRQAARAGWVAREVVDGVRALTRLCGEIHASAGGFTVRLGADHFRHEESGQRLELSGKAVVQLHRFCQRRGLSGLRFASQVPPLSVKNFARALLDPACDLKTVLAPGCGIDLLWAQPDPPAVLILRDGSGEGASLTGAADARPDRACDPLAPSGGDGSPPASRGAVADKHGAAPVTRAAAPALPRVTGALDQELQQLRRENAVIREAVAALATAGGGAPHPAILTCIEAMEQDAHLMYMLVSLRQHDRYTFDHSCNVALLAVVIARQIGVAGEELRRFAAAVLLHDIGKLYTPLSILNKPGRFAPEEWRTMKRHPQDGMEILDGAGFENLYSERVTLLHHVDYSGQGYPAAVTERPDLLAQVVQVADIYDAFTSIRPYRQQARPREVLETLCQGSGTKFDPTVVTAVHRVMGETPLGAVLKLDNGHLGLVVDMGGGLDGRPIVRVIQDEAGNRPTRTTLIDLSARIPATGEYVVDVVEAVDPVIRNIPIGRYI